MARNPDEAQVGATVRHQPDDGLAPFRAIAESVSAEGGDLVERVLIDLLAFQAAAAKVTVQSDEQLGQRQRAATQIRERILARNRVATQYRREQGGQSLFGVGLRLIFGS